MENDDVRRAELSAIIDKHVGELMKHFDAVQVFATIYDRSSGETETFDAGEGQPHGSGRPGSCLHDRKRRELSRPYATYLFG